MEAEKELTPNTPEKIIFCVDVSAEVDSLDFAKTAKKVGMTRLDCIKTAIRTFVYLKQKMNSEHQFGLMYVTDVPTWVQDPTDDGELFLRKVNALQSRGDFKSLDLSSVFELVYTVS
eukprot:TRINITY_DN2839_c0_g1_i2.p2 TRINITY_DN2839_c0_g1~~TRINITY_DN2839_c0_g1_i2.p2  ORF type:complete len:117 (-),score=20.92 TRINITY_DN2839_c0_g1_i2:477-827(-)